MAPVATIGCKVTGCDRPHRARGFCKTHYMRFHRTGSPFVDGRAVTRATSPSQKQYSKPIELLGTVTLEQWRRFRDAAVAVQHVEGADPLGARVG